MRDAIDAFLRQRTDEITTLDHTQQTLAQIAAQYRMRLAAKPAPAAIPATATAAKQPT